MGISRYKEAVILKDNDGKDIIDQQLLEVYLYKILIDLFILLMVIDLIHWLRGFMVIQTYGG